MTLEELASLIPHGETVAIHRLEDGAGVRVEVLRESSRLKVSGIVSGVSVQSSVVSLLDVTVLWLLDDMQDACLRLLQEESP
jgi:hypothetical protein